MQIKRASYCKVQGFSHDPVHVKKQNGGQQIKSKNFPARDIENGLRVTA